MKKLLILVMVLAMASLASAQLKISVGGVVDPIGPIELQFSDTVILDIHGDGADENPTPYLIVVGPGSINGGTMLYDQTPVPSVYAKYNDAEQLLATYWAPMTMEEALAFIASAPVDGGWGLVGATDFSFSEIIAERDPAPSTQGLLVDNIIFHCEGVGPVELLLISVSDEGVVSVLDTQIIHQIPEPVTIALLGLGGLLLRRRIA